MLEGVKNRAKNGPIKMGALNATLLTGTVISIGSILTYWTDFYEKIFGYKPEENPGAAAAIFAALAIAFGLIIGADLLARGIGSSRTSDTGPMPDGWTAVVVTSGEDEGGYAAVAIRITAGGPEYYVVKEKAGSWRQPGSAVGNIKLSSPA